MAIFGLEGPTFDGNPIDPFRDDLAVPDAQKVSGDIDMYADADVIVNLHTNLKGVPMWGFKRRPDENATSPGPLIEVKADDPLRVVGTMSWAYKPPIRPRMRQTNSRSRP